MATLATRLAHVTLEAAEGRCRACRRHAGARSVPAVLDGDLPRGDRDIMLGAATMRATGARLGDTVRVTISDPAGTPHAASFRTIGRASRTPA